MDYSMDVIGHNDICVHGYVFVFDEHFPPPRINHASGIVQYHLVVYDGAEHFPAVLGTNGHKIMAGF